MRAIIESILTDYLAYLNAPKMKGGTHTVFCYLVIYYNNKIKSSSKSSYACKYPYCTNEMVRTVKVIHLHAELGKRREFIIATL